MIRYCKHISCILLVSVLFAACKNVPDHTRYIPQNAIAVFGINSKEIGKKVAWNAITGSKLWKEMQQNMPVKEILEDVEKAGIDGNNTFYAYIVNDMRFAGGKRVTAVIPLTNAMKWESYVKKTFAGVEVSTVKNRKEAILPGDIYMAWNEDVLIAMNSFRAPGIPTMDEAYDMYGDVDSADATQADDVIAGNTAELAAEMEQTFNISDQNALKSNKRFEKLETKGHDITLWVNYDEVMTNMGSGMAMMTGGLSLSNKLWKDATFTAGWDFEKGCITGDMHYYTPPDMKDIAQEMGKTNTDNDMLERLPGSNINMLLSYHLSTNGLYRMLEEMGVLGFMNMALASQNMDARFIFDAVTGDMVMSANNFRLVKSGLTDTVISDLPAQANYSPEVDMVFALKIGKKENFQKLVQMAVDEGVLLQNGDRHYTIRSNSNMSLQVNDKYAVFASSEEIAQNYLDGKYKDQKMPVQASKEVFGHPFGMYFNIQSIAAAVQPGMTKSEESEKMLEEAKKLLQHVAFSGGEFKGDAFEYKMNVSFADKDENSLIQLMDFTMRMNQAANGGNISAR